MPTNERRLPGPYIIGATGGSGTRVVARIVRRGGMFIGSNLSRAEDAFDFRYYFNRWINPFMERSERWSTPALEIQEEMIQDLRVLLENHRVSLAFPHEWEAWGWKEPRSIYLLPFWHSQFPALKFLHVVRDGRDMAYSTNQNQLNKHGHTLLDAAEMHWSQPLRSMVLWSRINRLAADYGERHLGKQYLRIRFEDLCADPVSTIYRIFDFLGLQGDARQIAELEVRPPESLGRW